MQEGTDWYDFHARAYSPALGRFMQLDPIYNGPSGYVGMLNNPLMVLDPDGREPTLITALIISTAISALSYTASIAFSDGGFENWDWGQFGKNVGIGVESGAASFGIGSAFKGALEVTTLTAGQRSVLLIQKAVVHAHVQGTISGITGGDYVSSALSGLAGGAAGFATNGIGAGRNFAEIGSAMLLGGASAELSGGDFWRGATSTISNAC